MAGQQTSRAADAVEVLIDERVPTLDRNVTLSADVYLPTEDRWPAPVLVMVTPYRKDEVAGASVDAVHRWFAQHGYACVLVDAQGTGSSDGAPRPARDPGEGADGLAAIEWAAAQPWCDGTIGMWGLSNPGSQALRTAGLRPPRLKAVMAICSALDSAQTLYHPDGARCDLAMGVWAANMLARQLMPPLLNMSAPASQRRWQQRLHSTEPILFDLGRHGPGDIVWHERAVDPASIVVPTMLVAGWADLNPADDMIRGYEQLRGPKKLLVGPWPHAFPHNARFGAIDFLGQALRWWDHWLRGDDNGVMDEPAVTCYARGARPGWRTYDTWPPTHDELAFTTTDDTTLVEVTSTEPEYTGTRTIAEYRPDPTIGARSGFRLDVVHTDMLPESEPDQHDDDSRSLSSTSMPLDDDLLVAGRVEVAVRLAANGDGTPTAAKRIVVRLTDVDSRGHSAFVTAGVLTIDRPTTRCRIVLRPTLYRFGAGHRIRVAISESDFPRLWPLIDPVPLPIAAVVVHLPVAAEDVGTPTDLPSLAPASHDDLDRRENQPYWKVSRELVGDGIAILTGGRVDGISTLYGHRVSLHTVTQASVDPDATGNATIDHRYTISARLDTGETIATTSRFLLTQTCVAARGEVVIGGTTVYSREWRCDLDWGTERR